MQLTKKWGGFVEQGMNPRLEAFLHEVDCRKVATAVIYELVDTYYQQVAYTPPESDDDMTDMPFSEELKQPVEDRLSGIIVTLTQLINAGHDVNESDGSFNAMMLAVGHGDAPMVQFLIEHGAHVDTWPDMDEEPEWMRQNFYLEDINIHFMDECLANDKDLEYMKALHQTALVLSEVGHLGPYSGHCLKIDQDGNVSLLPPRMKY